MEMEINQSCNYWIFLLSVNVPVIFSVDQLIILTIKCQETEKNTDHSFLKPEPTLQNCLSRTQSAFRWKTVNSNRTSFETKKLN